MGAEPAETLARTEVNDMRTSAERFQPGPGTGVGILCRDQDYAAWPVPTL
ncbi:MAG: hypothetical protein ACRC6I_15460 [Paracoccaceae bacterium]